jgi:hypothetical protein
VHGGYVGGTRHLDKYNLPLQTDTPFGAVYIRLALSALQRCCSDCANFISRRPLNPNVSQASFAIRTIRFQLRMNKRPGHRQSDPPTA